ncbi:succinate-semialdehyde dehydrogenase/glutarate-semialdehyde dehydrogenase [Homoserinimonas aerilata]|uniref:Succinate-semialdehyde dehydrogenase/glutarate-semialdehyde dehydrogenase n=1 Tax=Homoserinimonas aerilata TaxID=1162970 RepID=A0A542YJY1_9MICO|nr:NAD-dependent succinate-semialdehyde dehydrogenase [Homoserinimonas aerilata]TQL48416.1 succinate-semialdehyde dehydrogenase/glutarate-semialdehyde dehydrogenase [Homoserinimonas aerilata]
MTSASIALIDPSTGDSLGSVPALDRDELDAALSETLAAQRAWRTTSLAERSELLRNVARMLRDEVEDHATLISREMGKPVTEARAEVLKCATTCDFYADHAEEFLSPKAVETEAATSFVAYEPLGVVLAVMPWNFPYWQVIRFAAPTLTAGNGGLLKHASNVTGSALAIESLFERAGYPKGLLRTLVLADHSLVNEIIADVRVAAVTLTGSEKAGASVAEAAGRALKKTVLELGGSDPFVILADADIAAVTPLAVRARFVNTGQSCLCAKRFIVEGDVIDRFEAGLKTAVEALKIGEPLDDATQIGPLAKPSFIDDIDRQVQESIAMGARLVTGGYRIDGPGNYYAPTVLADVTPDMPVFREETFGPVLALVRADSPAHAIELADDSQYGLAASVWTADMQAGIDLGLGIESGALFVNGVVVSDPRLPFGGVKLSGYGRELSVEGIREFTNVRSVWAGAMPRA